MRTGSSMRSPGLRCTPSMHKPSSFTMRNVCHGVPCIQHAQGLRCAPGLRCKQGLQFAPGFKPERGFGFAKVCQCAQRRQGREFFNAPTWSSCTCRTTRQCAHALKHEGSSMHRWVSILIDRFFNASPVCNAHRVCNAYLVFTHSVQQHVQGHIGFNCTEGHQWDLDLQS